MVYLDTSIFVSLYSRDVHSRRAQRIVVSNARALFSPLHRAELTHALFNYAFRKELTLEQANRLHALSAEDLENGLWLESALPDGVFELAASLGKKYAPKLGVRTLDTLHVASALLFKSKVFGSFDKRQLKLAQAEGLEILR